MKEISLKDIESNFFDNKLNIPNKEDYLSLYILYRKLFNKYIINTLNLKKYEEELKNSNLNFIPVIEKKQDIYQFIVSDELDYFYIRNNIYLEHLTNEEINYLRSLSNTNIDSTEFIEKTYKKVIFNDALNNGKLCKVFYGPQSKIFSAPNNALVLGFRYDSFNKNNLSEKEYMDNYDKQRILLKELFKELINNAQNTLRTYCSIIEYNEFSVELRYK